MLITSTETTSKSITPWSTAGLESYEDDHVGNTLMSPCCNFETRHFDPLVESSWSRKNEWKESSHSIGWGEFGRVGGIRSGGGNSGRSEKIQKICIFRCFKSRETETYVKTNTKCTFSAPTHPKIQKKTSLSPCFQNWVGRDLHVFETKKASVIYKRMHSPSAWMLVISTVQDFTECSYLHIHTAQLQLLRAHHKHRNNI